MQQLKQSAAVTPTWTEEAQRLADVLEAITAHEIKRRLGRAVPWGPQRVFSIAIPDHWDNAVADARFDPEAYVFRVRVREIGWQLYALGGLHAMRECCAAIQNDDALSHVDAAWTGIGVAANGLLYP